MSMNTKVAAEALMLCSQRLKRPDWKRLAEKIVAVMEKEANLDGKAVMQRVLGEQN